MDLIGRSGKAGAGRAVGAGSGCVSRALDLEAELFLL